MPVAVICDRYDVEAQMCSEAGNAIQANDHRKELARLREHIEESVKISMDNIRILPIPDDVACIAYVEAWLRRRGGWVLGT